MLKGQNIIVLDLEVAHSPDDCRHCGVPPAGASTLCEARVGIRCEPIGWDNKAALGLAIGGYYDYVLDTITWFDPYNLEDIMRNLVERAPLLVSFNGVAFDFPLMRGILRRRAEAQPVVAERLVLEALCDHFKACCNGPSSYDLLAEVWRADPDHRRTSGVHGLDALARANGLGAKTGHGAEAPRWWTAGRIADVLNYCRDDILLTRALFEHAAAHDGWLQREGLPPVQLAPLPAAFVRAVGWS